MTSINYLLPNRRKKRRLGAIFWNFIWVGHGYSILELSCSVRTLGHIVPGFLKAFNPFWPRSEVQTVRLIRFDKLGCKLRVEKVFPGQLRCAVTSGKSNLRARGGGSVGPW